MTVAHCVFAFPAWWVHSASSCRTPRCHIQTPHSVKPTLPEAPHIFKVTDVFTDVKIHESRLTLKWNVPVKNGAEIVRYRILYRLRREGPCEFRSPAFQIAIYAIYLQQRPPNVDKNTFDHHAHVLFGL